MTCSSTLNTAPLATACPSCSPTCLARARLLCGSCAGRSTLLGCGAFRLRCLGVLVLLRSGHRNLNATWRQGTSLSLPLTLAPAAGACGGAASDGCGGSAGGGIGAGPLRQASPLASPLPVPLPARTGDSTETVLLAACPSSLLLPCCPGSQAAASLLRPLLQPWAWRSLQSCTQRWAPLQRCCCSCGQGWAGLCCPWPSCCATWWLAPSCCWAPACASWAQPRVRPPGSSESSRAARPRRPQPHLYSTFESFEQGREARLRCAQCIPPCRGCLGGGI